MSNPTGESRCHRSSMRDNVRGHSARHQRNQPATATFRFFAARSVLSGCSRMRIFDRYIGRQVLGATLIAVLVLSVVMVLGIFSNGF